MQPNALTDETIIIEQDSLKAYIYRLENEWMGMRTYVCDWCITVDGNEHYHHEHDTEVSLASALKFARAVTNAIRVLHRGGGVIFANSVSTDDRARSRSSLYEFVGFQPAPEDSGFELWYVG